jgi:hypothetical protein
MIDRHATQETRQTDTRGTVGQYKVKEEKEDRRKESRTITSHRQKRLRRASSVPCALSLVCVPQPT